MGGDSHTHTLTHSQKSAPLAARIQAIEFAEPEEMHRHYQRAEVYVGTSRCESFGISVAEALSCGCRVALAPGIGVPSYRWFAMRGGVMAERRTGKAMAEAVGVGEAARG